jgi:hypothetical protein
MKRIVIRCLSGMGNRMLALIGAAVLADRHGWELQYQWPIVPVTPRKAEWVWFPLKLTDMWDTDLKEVSKKYDPPEAVKIGLDITQKFKPVYLPEEGIVMMDGHGFMNLDGKGKCVAELHSAFHKHFSLVEPQQKLVNQYKKEFFVPGHTIGIQIRARGRHVAPWKPVARMEALIDRKLKADPKAIIFLSCEEITVVSRFKRQWKGRIFSYNKPPEINTPEAMMTSVRDVYLMADADQYYGTPGSGFGNLPWLMRKDHDEKNPFEVPLPQRK